MNIESRLNKLEQLVKAKKRSNPLCFEVIYKDGKRQFLDPFSAMVATLRNDDYIVKMVYYSELGGKETEEKAAMTAALIPEKFETNKDPITAAMYQFIEEQKARRAESTNNNTD